MTLQYSLQHLAEVTYFLGDPPAQSLCFHTPKKTNTIPMNIERSPD